MPIRLNDKPLSPALSPRRGAKRERRFVTQPDGRSFFFAIFAFFCGQPLWLLHLSFIIYHFLVVDIPALKAIIHRVCIGAHSIGAEGREGETLFEA